MNWKSLLRPIEISGAEILPLVEGGKGIAVSDGASSGAWAATGGVGTFSAVNPHIPGLAAQSMVSAYSSSIRVKRHAEMIEKAIKGGIAQARIAYETACHQGRIHMNVLWEMGGVEEILHGILSKVKGLVHGVTCGAGMPFRLAEICAKYNIKYYPIVSSARAFGILWHRAYSRLSEWLGGVVYEDPWLAGGHNGLSTLEDEKSPEEPKGRVKNLRDFMRSVGLNDTIPIFLAGGVWWLSEWLDFFNKKEFGAIAFQFGTRPLLTQESPIPASWKKRLLTLKKGDVVLNRFSPTGFPSSVVQNDFLKELQARTERQVTFSTTRTPVFSIEWSQGTFIQESDLILIKKWQAAGFTEALSASKNSFVFVTPEQREEIQNDRILCVGCLSACKFSGWDQNPETSRVLQPDARFFCIQKSLQTIAIQGDTKNSFMFCGHNGYRFAEDPFYANGFIPTVKELVERIQTGL
jgi:NAD(P)H-dependent flavin oxidoreductase YrpB (nitropropane dioxygenase family)